MKLRNAQGILSSDVPTGNLIWVDQVNGNDSLAIRGRMKIPFRTLSQAKNAAIPGDTIIVMPGWYQEWNLAKLGVNWHFIPGAKVDPGPNATGPVFDVAGNMAVTGYGEFGNGLSGSSVLNLTGGTVSFKCRSIVGSSGAKCVTVSDGFNFVEADYAWGGAAICLDITGGASNVFRIRDVRSDGSHAVSNAAGTTEIEAFRIRSYAGKGVYFTGGSLMVAAAEILSTTDNALEYNNAYTALCNIIGARLISTFVSTLGRAVYIASTSNGLKLSRCVLVAYSTAPSISAAAANTVNLYGECIANTAKSANITIASPGSVLTVNSNIS